MATKVATINQSTDLYFKSIDWSLYDDSFGF